MQVFSDQWFKVWRASGEVWTAPEAVGECPRKILTIPGETTAWKKHQVVNAWESQEDRPQAMFEFREQALLYVTAVAAESDHNLSLGANEDEEGWYPLYSLPGSRRRTGGLWNHEAEVKGLMQALHAVVANPTLLCNLMEAAGPGCLEAAGQLLAQRLQEARREELSEGGLVT